MARFLTIASSGFLGSYAQTVPTITLGNSGVEMPMAIVGTWLLNETEAYVAVSEAINAGFTGAHCDWAYFNLYGCGKALRQAFEGGIKREDFYVQASVMGYGLYWDHLVDPNATAAEGTRIQIEETLFELHVDYLDHVFLHTPPASVASYHSCGAAEAAGEHACKTTMEQWKVMEEFYKAGKIKSLGVSNFCTSCWDCLADAEVQPVLNQLMMHVGWGKDMLGIWSSHKKRGVVPQAYGPLGHGSELDPEVLNGNVTKAIAAAHNKSTAEIALKWLVANDIPLAVQSTNPAHLKSDIDLWSWELSADEMETLDTWIDNTTIMPSWMCSVWDETETSHVFSV